MVAKSGPSFSFDNYFAAVVVSWVFFRAETFESAILVLSGMMDLTSVVLPNALRWPLGPFADILLLSGIQFGSSGGVMFVQSWLWILGGFVIVFLFPNTREVFANFLKQDGDVAGSKAGLGPGVLARGLERWKPDNRWAACVAAMAVASILSLTRISEFLYFQF